MKNKPLINSLTVNSAMVGAVVFAARLLLKDYADPDELNGTVDLLKSAWVDGSGLVACLAAIWRRIAATNFDKSVLKQSTTWMGVLQGIAVAAAAMGYDIDPDQVGLATQKTFEVVTSLITAATSVGVIYGRVRAKKPVTIRKATPV